jgi:hypothetical protein
MFDATLVIMAAVPQVSYKNTNNIKSVFPTPAAIRANFVGEAAGAVFK